MYDFLFPSSQDNRKKQADKEVCSNPCRDGHVPAPAAGLAGAEGDNDKKKKYEPLSADKVLNPDNFFTESPFSEANMLGVLELYAKMVRAAITWSESIFLFF